MTFTPKTAMIFAAGLGTRMRPLTSHTPKAMVEVLGKTMIDYRIDKLVEFGIERIVINTHYLADQIEAHVKHRKDVEIIISYEPELLETGGGLVKALPHLGTEPFFITNCDTIWLDDDNKNTALSRMANMYDKEKMNILMLLQPLSEAIGYEGFGDFNLADDQTILWPKPPCDYVYTGLQICDPALFSHLEIKPFSLAELWREHILSSKSKNNIYGIVHTGHWLHVDSVANLHAAETFLKEHP
jgi:MurNAc alpha-1-phosphate uridylyltransferase